MRVWRNIVKRSTLNLSNWMHQCRMTLPRKCKTSKLKKIMPNEREQLHRNVRECFVRRNILISSNLFIMLFHSFHFCRVNTFLCLFFSYIWTCIIAIIMMLRDCTVRAHADLTYTCHNTQSTEVNGHYIYCWGHLFLKYNYLFWLSTVVPFKIDLKSFPRSAFVFINPFSARLVSLKYLSFSRLSSRIYSK